MMKYALYDYLPGRLLKAASFDQRDLNRRILDFKDGRNYAKRWAARAIAYSLQCTDLRDVVLICIPASCQHTYVRRYKRFAREFCRLSQAVNGFDMVKVISRREKKHLSRDRSHISCVANAIVDEGITGRKVLLVDDICTTCASANDFIRFLSAAGAEVVMTVFLAKTRTP